jgi:hypothetical protein
MVIAGIGGGSFLPLFKDILRISNHMKQVENSGFYFWAIAILLENDPVLLRRVDQIRCLARFLCKCVSIFGALAFGQAENTELYDVDCPIRLYDLHEGDGGGWPNYAI